MDVVVDDGVFDEFVVWFVGLVVAGGGYGWALLGLWWPEDIVGFFFCFFTLHQTP